MGEEKNKLRKRIEREAEEHIEIDDSDVPVHERFAKEEYIKKAKKKEDL